MFTRHVFEQQNVLAFSMHAHIIIDMYVQYRITVHTVDWLAGRAGSYVKRQRLWIAK